MDMGTQCDSPPAIKYADVSSAEKAHPDVFSVSSNF